MLSFWACLPHPHVCPANYLFRIGILSQSGSSAMPAAPYIPKSFGRGRLESDPGAFPIGAKAAGLPLPVTCQATFCPFLPLVASTRQCSHNVPADGVTLRATPLLIVLLKRRPFCCRHCPESAGSTVFLFTSKCVSLWFCLFNITLRPSTGNVFLPM